MHRRRRGGEIGRRSRLKICRWKHRAGSIPAPGTTSEFHTILQEPKSLAGFCFHDLSWSSPVSSGTLSLPFLAGKKVGKVLPYSQPGDFAHMGKPANTRLGSIRAGDKIRQKSDGNRLLACIRRKIKNMFRQMACRFGNG